MGEQGAVTLLALAPETGEIQQGVAPDELRAYAVRDAIGVVVETIAAVLDNGKILCSGLGIRRAASPAGAQEGNVVMVNVIALRLVVAAGLDRSRFWSISMMARPSGRTVMALPCTSTSCDAATWISGPQNQSSAA